ncbi:MAG TPA: hypothetical protein VIR57_00130 [Chloroflexota bacterium]|jgi:hypothetical protein
MSEDRIWFSLLGRCSGCGKPAVFERYALRIVTKLCPDGLEHDSEACKAARDEALKRATKASKAA